MTIRLDRATIHNRAVIVDDSHSYLYRCVRRRGMLHISLKHQITALHSYVKATFLDQIIGKRQSNFS